ncbi:MAG: 5'-methylthioadenosine/adenosylhomocysteine nucleosidase [Clostridiales bacterium]|nr:MAG: 5'-methylthioadenosine/adenosylhomocysteine nucleosidase [Clostridiales bacterium]
MVGIICAMDIELEKILAAMEDIETCVISNIKYNKGMIKGNEAVAAVCGVGKVNAAICAQTMILQFSPDLIINSGVAGGLSDSLNTTDIVIADKVAEHDMDTTPLGDEPGFIYGLNTVKIECDNKTAQTLFDCVESLGIHCEKGLIASGDQFINGGEKMEYIKNTFNASAAEMEGAAVGHVCALNNIPFCVLRSISDKADGSSHMDYLAFTKIASQNSANAIIRFMESYKSKS